MAVKNVRFYNFCKKVRQMYGIPGENIRYIEMSRKMEKAYAKTRIVPMPPVQDN